ncbi:MAG: hypothetical protein AB8Z23_02115 [Coxiella-like endosymbiont]|uniref:hypothetical protein n=1 Tax=Coxiella-like endosymbiont TaxID=1592897 RepID=UPI00215B3190|nr:hypothetical protein [Coxiella-like endosymbiont]UVE59281.1 hypothetical protein LG660_02275 [Coxiella-like endosymbiont]
MSYTCPSIPRGVVYSSPPVEESLYVSKLNLASTPAYVINSMLVAPTSTRRQSQWGI